MLIYLDTGNLDEITSIMPMLNISGITTNPKLADNELANKISSQFKLPTSIQVDISNYSNAIVLAKQLHAANKLNVIKVPITNPDLGKAIIDLGIPVNFTLCFSFAQVVLASNLGATMASVFVGRALSHNITNIGEVLRSSAKYLETSGSKTKLLAASIRNQAQFELAASSGAHIATLPPKLIREIFDLDNQLSRAGLEQFQSCFTP